MTLPRMGFDITGLTYDAERKLGKLKQYKLQDSGDNTVLRTQFAPVPYNINFGLYILSKNTEDALQIVEQILPFFTPDFTVTMTTCSALLRKEMYLLYFKMYLIPMNMKETFSLVELLHGH